MHTRKLTVSGPLVRNRRGDAELLSAFFNMSFLYYWCSFFSFFSTRASLATVEAQQEGEQRWQSQVQNFVTNNAQTPVWSEL